MTLEIDAGLQIGGGSIPSYTWITRPSATGVSGQLILITDVGKGGALFISDGTHWKPVAPIIIGGGGAAVSHTGDTAETIFAQTKIPANSLGLTGGWRFEAIFSTNSGNTNAKTFRGRWGPLGTIADTALPELAAYVINSATAIELLQKIQVWNLGAENSQLQTGGNYGNGGQSANQFAISAIDTTVDTYISLTGQLATATDTVTLNAWRLELLA